MKQLFLFWDKWPSLKSIPKNKSYKKSRICKLFKFLFVLRVELRQDLSKTSICKRSDYDKPAADQQAQLPFSGPFSEPNYLASIVVMCRGKTVPTCLPQR